MRLRAKPFLFAHKPRGWNIKISYRVESFKTSDKGCYDL